MRSSSSLTSIPSDLKPYLPPVQPRLFSMYWIILLSIGITFALAYFVYNMSVSRSKRSIIVEILLATISSISCGVGMLYLLLWAGVWV